MTKEGDISRNQNSDDHPQGTGESAYKQDNMNCIHGLEEPMC